MVNEVSEKVKALAKSKKAMKEELSRLQENLKNMSKEESQPFDLIELKEKIKFQEPIFAVTNRDADFYIKVDDDVHVHAALEWHVLSRLLFQVPVQLSVSKIETVFACPIQSIKPTKKVMMIFQELKRPQQPKNVGLEQGPMNANCTYAAREVIDDVFDFLSSSSIKNGGDPFCCDGYLRERGKFLGGSSTINVRFYSQVYHNFFKESVMNWDQRSEFDFNEMIAYEEVALIKEEESKKIS